MNSSMMPDPGADAGYPIAHFAAMHPAEVIDLASDAKLLDVARNTVQMENDGDSFAPGGAGFCLAWPPAAKVANRQMVRTTPRQARCLRICALVHNCACEFACACTLARARAYAFMCLRHVCFRSQARATLENFTRAIPLISGANNGTNNGWENDNGGGLVSSVLVCSLPFLD